MTGPSLDLVLLVQLLTASEREAATAVRGQSMPAAEALQMELWRQRRAIVSALTKTRRPPRPANTNLVDEDQPGLFDPAKEA
jgi:hypothetical protein